MSAQETAMLIARELEGQSLNAIVAGFSFAAALSWVDLVRWVVNQVVDAGCYGAKINRNIA